MPNPIPDIKLARFQSWYNKNKKGTLKVDGVMGKKTQPAYDAAYKEFLQHQKMVGVAAPELSQKDKNIAAASATADKKTQVEKAAAFQKDVDAKKAAWDSGKSTTDPGTTGKRFVDKIAPYASNIINSFRKPPMPNKPISHDLATIPRVNFAPERDEVRRGIRAENLATEANVGGGNTAEAVKRFNSAQEFNRISAINEKENNANMALSTQEAQMNTAIKTANTNQLNAYNAEKVARDIAQQREQSANLANAGDKYVGIKNEEAKNALEEKKWGWFTKTDQLGTLGRAAKDLEDPYYLANKRKKATGGPLDPPVADNTYLRKPAITRLLTPEEKRKAALLKNPYSVVARADIDTRWEGDSIRYMLGQTSFGKTPYVRDGLGARGTTVTSGFELAMAPGSRTYIDSSLIQANVPAYKKRAMGGFIPKFNTKRMMSVYK